MTASHYAAGTRFEHRVRDDLRAHGYSVLRAAGSKGDSKIDLVAIKPGQVVFIQCKRSGALGPAEWNRIVEVAGWVGALPVLAASGALGRGIEYTHLLGPKVAHRRSQPVSRWLPDELGETR
jgi:Holliday junction resolvase